MLDTVQLQSCLGQHTAAALACCTCQPPWAACTRLRVHPSLTTAATDAAAAGSAPVLPCSCIASHDLPAPNHGRISHYGR